MIVMAISDCLKEVTLVLSGDMPMNILLFGRMLMANFPKVTLFTISMELSMITALEAIRDTVTLVPFFPSGDTAKTSYNVKLTQLPMRFYVENQQSRAGYIEVTVEEIFKG